MSFRIETERIVLREVEFDDLDDLAAIYADPETMRFIGSGETRSREHTEETIRRYREVYAKNGYGLWAVEERATGAFLGRVGLIDWEIESKPEVEVAYTIGRPSWGRGFATEAARATRDWAFENLPVPHLISLVHADNHASERVALKNGMRHTRDTSYGDKEVRVFSIERAEWEEARRT